MSIRPDAVLAAETSPIMPESASRPGEVLVLPHGYRGAPDMFVDERTGDVLHHGERLKCEWWNEPSDDFGIPKSKQSVMAEWRRVFMQGDR